MKLTYCLVTLNRLDELQRACRTVCPHVDRTCIVDGGSTDGSIEWLQSHEAKQLKIELLVSPQVRLARGNHTPGERNKYLEMAGSDGWILTTDTDEFLEEAACKDLRRLAEEGERDGITGYRFRAHDITLYKDGRVYDNQTDYYNPMFFKSCPGIHYVGHTHSAISRPGLGNAGNWRNVNYEYIHQKTEQRIWQSSTYLFWTTARVAQNITDTPEWLEFHRLMEKYGHTDWHKFNKVMDAGQVPDEICQWFIDHRNSKNPEERAWFVHYFIFKHPELNVKKLSNIDFTDPNYGVTQ